VEPQELDEAVGPWVVAEVQEVRQKTRVGMECRCGAELARALLPSGAALRVAEREEVATLVAWVQVAGVRVALLKKYCRLVHGHDGQAEAEAWISSFPPTDSVVGTVE
jgi:hypothetical protein